jgi:hypothetical protein
MFRNLPFVLVIGLVIVSCRDKKQPLNPSNNFDIKAYYKDNQNTRVMNFLNDSDLLSSDFPQEIYFVNRAGCNACLNSKYEELLVILELTQVKSFIIFNDSSYFRELENPNVSYHYVPTKTLKSKKIFHSTPWLYSYSNNKLIDRNLTVQVCDSLLNRWK